MFTYGTNYRSHPNPYAANEMTANDFYGGGRNNINEYNNAIKYTLRKN